MTDTRAALEKARAIIEEAHSGRFKQKSLRIIDDIEAIALGDPDGAETAIGAYYEAETGAKPFEHPGDNRYLVRKARVILICCDLLEGREPKPKYMFGKDAVRSRAFSEELEAYREWMESRDLSESTVSSRLQRADVLLRYLEEHGVSELSEVDAEGLARFIAWLGGRFTPIGKSNILYTLRNLFRCPAIEEKLSFDPFGLLTNLHTPKHNRIPSVYSAEEIAMTLAAIDRSTHAGRTLYLVTMLAAVYGMRSMDIKELKVGDIDFARGVITMVQHKTGFPLELPLLDCVKLPLLDYMMNTRRRCGCENVLVRFRGAPGPYSPRNHFGSLRDAMERGGVIIGGRKAGLHSLRHSLASGMLASGVPADEIASVLGHQSANATKAYIWSDVEGLRAAALDVG